MTTKEAVVAMNTEQIIMKQTSERFDCSCSLMFRPVFQLLTAKPTRTVNIPTLSSNGYCGVASLL